MTHISLGARRRDASAIVRMVVLHRVGTDKRHPAADVVEDPTPIRSFIVSNVVIGQYCGAAKIVGDATAILSRRVVDDKAIGHNHTADIADAPGIK